MTQLELARNKKITSLFRTIARIEGCSPEDIRDKVSRGTCVVPKNNKRSIKKPCGIGQGLRTKINANIGTSPQRHNLGIELKKLKIAIDSGADTVMDLSTGGDLKKIRREILINSSVPVGSVPIYEAAINALKSKGSIAKMDSDDIFKTIESQAKDGIDFVTVHCGVTRSSIAHLRSQKRLTDIVSRGGAFLAGWIIKNNKENPLFEDFDELIKISKKYDITLSLGDGLRPGSLNDATDRAQIQELILLAELAQRAKAKGVQVMIEGPGHVPMHQIEANVILQKKLTNNAPFYVLGPLVTDVAPGYDHITAAIGGAIAAKSGADFLCYVTPSEHLGLPDVEDVKTGVIASRIAAHAADISKGIKGASLWDNELSTARKKRNWKKQASLAMDSAKFEKYQNQNTHKDGCTMCSDYCSMKLIEDFFKEVY